MLKKDYFDGQLIYGSEKKFNNLSNRTSHYLKDKINLSLFSKKIKQKKFQKFRNCEVCGSKKSKNLFIKDNFNHVQCQSCGFIYVNPCLKNDIHFNFSVNESSYTKVLKNKINKKLDKKKFQYGLQKLKIKNKKTILDIGCAFGTFLNEAKKKNLRIFGSELNKYCIKYLKKKKIKNIDLENCEIKFDYITLWTVFEHIAEANQMLKKIYNLLNKDGKLLINVPNVESLSARIFHKDCSMFSGEQHVNMFSKFTLEKILKKNNFKIIETETILSDIAKIKNHLNLNSTKSKNLPFLNTNFLHKRHLGYTLLNISQKI